MGRSCRRVAGLGLTVTLLVASTVELAAQVPSVPVPAVPTAADLLPLPSTPAPRLAPEASAVDFANAPDTASTRRRPAFAAAKARLLDEETTATKRVYLNPDGTRTAQLTALPTRYREPSGAWRDIDRRLQPGTDLDELVPTAGPATEARLARRANGITRLTAADGTVLLRHPDATAVAGVVADDRVRYPGRCPAAPIWSSMSSAAGSRSRSCCPTPRRPPPT